jgi:N-acetylmuramoyl-L-alanine amidase
MTIEEMLSEEILALTLWGEARGETAEGQIAVANVITNRFRRQLGRYKTIKDVCLEPKQFSCWNKDDPNREKMLKLSEQFKREITDKMLKQVHHIAVGAISGIWIDNTGNSINYMTNTLFHSENRPSWARFPRNPTQIGNHTFFTV